MLISTGNKQKFSVLKKEVDFVLIEDKPKGGDI